MIMSSNCSYRSGRGGVFVYLCVGSVFFRVLSSSLKNFLNSTPDVKVSD